MILDCHIDTFDNISINKYTCALFFAAANVGIAMGVGGSALAVEAASMVIMSNNLLKVPAACRLCRDTVRIIVINCGLSIAIKLIAAILACTGIMLLHNLLYLFVYGAVCLFILLCRIFAAVDGRVI